MSKKPCLVFCMFHFFVPLVDGIIPITGSFIKDFINPDIKNLAVLLQNGARSFVYYYFDKPYEITIDIPSDVEGLSGYHVCSDLMLTFFLQDNKENIWQCDLPGYIPTLLKFDCRILENVKRPNCTDRHANFAPLNMKSVVAPPETAEAISINSVLTMAIVLLLCVIAIFLAVIVIFMYKKERAAETVYTEANNGSPFSSLESHVEDPVNSNDESAQLIQNGNKNNITSSSPQNPVQSSNQDMSNADISPDTKLNPSTANKTMSKMEQRKERVKTLNK